MLDLIHIDHIGEYNGIACQEAVACDARAHPVLLEAIQSAKSSTNYATRQPASQTVRLSTEPGGEGGCSAGR